MRYPTPATLLSRPIYLIVLLPFAILLHLLLSSPAISETESYRPQGLDARVGWSSDYDGYNDGEDPGFAGRAGAALSGIGNRLGRLAAGKPPPGSDSFNRQENKQASSGSSKSIFQRTGGSLYELVGLSPSSLYDVRTSLDKLRLTSTRFVSSTPPSPYAAFSGTNERQHILVTGGFSSLGRSLVRDLLLLGENSGAEEEDDKKGSFGDAFNLGGWWGGKPTGTENEEDKEDDMFVRKTESERLLATANKGKKQGIVITLLDTTNRSLELDDMLKHAPLYHRSRRGFNLPFTMPGASSSSSSEYSDDMFIPTTGDAQKHDGHSSNDQPTPPLEFVDPRSAAFSSSEVSLASFIAKGRLRIIRGDGRNLSLLTTLLNPSSSSTSSSSSSKSGKIEKMIPAKSRFGIPKRPHHQTDEAQPLPPISGIYHLAGYESSLECTRGNSRDCADLERNGVEALASALGEMDEEGRRPWIVLGDRGNLEHDGVRKWLQDGTPPPSHQLVDKRNLTSSLAHGRAVQQKRDYFSLSSSYLNPLANLARTKKVHAISLRLPPSSHIFGDSFSSRTESPISHLVHSAIGHLPIVVDEDSFPDMQVAATVSQTGNPEELGAMGAEGREQSVWHSTGVVYIDDLVETLISAGELLSRSNRAEYLSRMSILAEIEILPPASSSATSSGSRLFTSDSTKSIAQETVDWIIQLTKSSSPVGYIQSSTSSLAGEALLSGKALDRTLARRVLGTTPSTPLPLALKAYIRSLLGRQTTYLDAQIGDACAPPPDLRTLGDALSQLDTCNIQLLGLVSAENVVLACNSGYTNDTAQSPLVLSSAVPYKEGINQVKLKARWGPVGRVDVGILCPFGPNGSDERISWIESTTEVSGRWATSSEVTRLSSFDSTLWVYESFEVNFIRRDTRSMTLSIPQYPQATPDQQKRRMVFTIDHSRKNGKDGEMKDMLVLNWQTLAETSMDWQTMEWRLNPICCGKKVVKEINRFTFLREDPLYTSQILYPSSDGSTSVAESTYEIQRCRDFRSAHDYSKKLSLWNERTSTDRTCPRPMSEGSDWFSHDLPICSVDCGAPVACLVTDKCRCTRDICGDEKPLTKDFTSPQEEVEYTNELSYPYDGRSEDSLKPAVQTAESATEPLTLQQKVDSLPWDAVIQPSARQLFSLPISSLPKGHVVSLPHDVDNHMDNPACYDLSKANSSTMADHFLIQALQQYNANMEDASFVVVPYYQGCYHDYLKENTYKKLADTIASAETQIVLSDTLKASNIVIPFLHDWGSCTGWWPHVEEVLSRTPPPPMSKAISWQVNGDLNTRCVKAERDVVVPAATKHAPGLMSKYSDLSKVTPSSERKHLAFFHGEVEGYGAFARIRLGCGMKEGDHISDILYRTYAKGSDYLGTLGESKFCLLPRGIAGWSPASFDAIYAGCIPVFIADRTSHPFNSILSYSSFSLAIPENEIHNLRSVLSSISPKQMDKMQVALLKIRDAFIYSDDPAKEWTRRGPLYFTLLAMAEKLALEWPTLPVHNICK